MFDREGISSENLGSAEVYGMVRLLTAVKKLSSTFSRSFPIDVPTYYHDVKKLPFWAQPHTNLLTERDPLW